MIQIRKCADSVIESLNAQKRRKMGKIIQARGEDRGRKGAADSNKSMKYLIGYIGEYDSLPEPALAVYEHDIDKLEKLAEEGTDFSETIRLGQWSKLTPLEIAVYRDDVEMVKWLIAHGANVSVVLKALLNAAGEKYR